MLLASAAGRVLCAGSATALHAAAAPSVRLSRSVLPTALCTLADLEAFSACHRRKASSHTKGASVELLSVVLCGGPGGSEAGGEPAGLACRPRRMALRLSSSRGWPRRCKSYSSRSFSALSCSFRSSSRLLSSSSNCYFSFMCLCSSSSRLI